MGTSHQRQSGDHRLDLVSQSQERTDSRTGDDRYGGRIVPHSDRKMNRAVTRLESICVTAHGVSNSSDHGEDLSAVLGEYDNVLSQVMNWSDD